MSEGFSRSPFMKVRFGYGSREGRTGSKNFPISRERKRETPSIILQV